MFPVQNSDLTIRHYCYNKGKKLGKGATGSVYLGTLYHLCQALTRVPASRLPLKSSI
jgi:hypothetical protein